MHPRNRMLAAAAIADASVGALPVAAAAQCPVASTCYFGTDVNGSSTLRATNVNSIAARNNFFAVLSGVGTETFEGRSGAGTPLPLIFPGAGTATLNGGGSVVTQGAGTNNFGRYPTSGTAYFEATSAAGGGTTFSIAFATPIAAFGFYGIDIGGLGSQLTLRFSLVGGGFADWALPYVATNGVDTQRDGSLLFAGFTNATQFTSVSFIGTNSSDSFAFDDMTIGTISQVTVPPGTTVPEPSTYVLVATGLATLAAIARRRQSA